MSSLRRTTLKQGPPGPPGAKNGTPTNWTPGTIANGAYASTTVACVGAVVGLPALAAWTTVLAAGLVLYAVTSAADVVTVYLFNHSGSSASVSAGVVQVKAFTQ